MILSCTLVSFTDHIVDPSYMLTRREIGIYLCYVLLFCFLEKPLESEASESI